MRNDSLVLSVVLLSALTQACGDEKPTAKNSRSTKEAVVADAGSDPMSDAAGGEDIVDSAMHADRSFARVMEIFTAKCLPCHASGPGRNAAGKLDLGSASAAYEQLVDVAAQGGPCASSGDIRVVPGDPDASLLMAKLENTPEMCGAPMPKPGANQEFMSLSDAELAEVAAWIEAGAPAE